MKIVTINIGTTFAFDLTFTADAQGQTLFFTAATKIKASDADATIKKSFVIPSGTAVLTYTATLLPSETTVAEAVYYANWRLVGSTVNVGDSETFLLKVEQGPTTRVA